MTLPPSQYESLIISQNLPTEIKFEGRQGLKGLRNYPFQKLEKLTSI